MRALRVERIVAVTATGTLMAGGAAIGSAGTASASNYHNSGYRHCYSRGWNWNWNDGCYYGRGYNAYGYGGGGYGGR
ncbi:MULTISPECIES: hypothetical protein [Streptomyces]|uniref:hypothetical protein n=1 Tax=Streptomyces TaxID=1883 RepID=UPI002E191DE6|nr:MULTISPECIES: hypothetical protein [unclassified Streptomyces]